MDSDLDNALIQSEALYCLRREQLVNLCKRRGIKARGKAPELADFCVRVSKFIRLVHPNPSHLRLPNCLMALQELHLPR